MSMETALSIGMGLIQHRQAVGAALNGLSQLSGGDFGKIAQKFHLPKGVSQPIQKGLKEMQNLPQSNTLQVLAGLNSFDADRDGNLTQNELTQGLSEMKSNGQASTKKGAARYQLGETMLKNYTQIASLDGHASNISLKDTLKLANQDGKITNVSTRDWQSLNA